MQISLWPVLPIPGTPIASSSIHRWDTPTVSSAMTAINAAVSDLNKSVVALTAANVATQVDRITAKLNGLKKTAEVQGAKIGSSLAMGFRDLTTLLTIAQLLGTTANRTSPILSARRGSLPPLKAPPGSTLQSVARRTQGINGNFVILSRSHRVSGVFPLNLAQSSIRHSMESLNPLSAF
jgi:hypothetical protein